jgi:DNA-binding NarL/FixJ family response regulator
MGTNNTTIILADDHPLMRKGLRDVIEEEKRYTVIGECGNGRQAVEKVRTLRPDIALFDIDMPGMDGLEAAAEIIRQKLPTRIIFLTMYDQENIFNRAMDIGAFAYVMKESAVAEIMDAIRSVAAGKYYVSPSMSGSLLKRNNAASVQPALIPSLSLLTPAERKILKLISEQHTTAEIALELSVSPRTVESHRSNICQKLSVTGNNALLKFALEHKSKL